MHNRIAYSSKPIVKDKIHSPIKEANFYNLICKGQWSPKSFNHLDFVEILWSGGHRCSTCQKVSTLKSVNAIDKKWIL